MNKAHDAAMLRAMYTLYGQLSEESKEALGRAIPAVLNGRRSYLDGSPYQHKPLDEYPPIILPNN